MIRRIPPATAIAAAAAAAAAERNEGSICIVILYKMERYETVSVRTFFFEDDQRREQAKRMKVYMRGEETGGK